MIALGRGTGSGRPIGGQGIPAKKEKEVAAALLKGDRGMQKNIARELSVGVSVVQRVKAQLREQMVELARRPDTA